MFRPFWGLLKKPVTTGFLERCTCTKALSVFRNALPSPSKVHTFQMAKATPNRFGNLHGPPKKVPKTPKNLRKNLNEGKTPWFFCFEQVLFPINQSQNVHPKKTR